MAEQDRRLGLFGAEPGDIGGVVGHRDAGDPAIRPVPAQVRRQHLEPGRLEGRAEGLERPAAAEGAVHHNNGGHLNLSSMLAQAF
jgi:hypothetical protein